jgi:hypothetical protein
MRIRRRTARESVKFRTFGKAHSDSVTTTFMTALPVTLLERRTAPTALPWRPPSLSSYEIFMAMIPRILHDQTVPSTPNLASAATHTRAAAPPRPTGAEQGRTYCTEGESAPVFARLDGAAKTARRSSFPCGSAAVCMLCRTARIRVEGWKLGPLVGYAENLFTVHAY